MCYNCVLQQKGTSMALKVEVLDSVMGSGKTTEVFKWIDANPDVSYIYVSPMLTEVDTDGRIHQEVNNVKFHSPISDNVQNKTDSMNTLLSEGKSIACTHNLYLAMDNYSMDLIERGNYCVIFDEEINVMSDFKGYSVEDILWLEQEGYITRDDSDGSVVWNKEDELLESNKHSYSYFKNLCDKKSLYITRFDKDSSPDKKVMMISQVPVRLLECANRVIAITYMFKGSVLDSFLKLKGFKTVPFTEVKVSNIKPSYYKSLITLIPPDEKTKSMSLSASWWLNRASGEDIKAVRNYILRNARKYAGTPDKLSFTLPKDRAKDLNKSSKTKTVNPIGFVYHKDEDGNKVHNWLAAQTRATNKYSSKTTMIHCYNRYPLLTVSSYLQEYKQPLDQDVFALSELLQWAFRGCVREGKPMVLCCASQRMYNLVDSWLNDEFVIEGV